MTWSQLPSIPTARDRSQAGLVTYPNGAKGVLVAGGTGTTSVEFLNLETLIWEPKANLPKEIHFHVLVNVNNTHMVILGGQDMTDQVYIHDR